MRRYTIIKDKINTLEYEYASSSYHEHPHKNDQKNEESENYPILKNERYSKWRDNMRVRKYVKMKPTTLALP